MYKWMYDRMVKEYEKESKEELIQRILAMKEIECKDRCFAEHFKAGTAIINFDELFVALEDLQSEFSYEKAKKIYELSELARNNWNYIRDGLVEMDDNDRCSKVLEDFKSRVNGAEDEMDLI